MSIKLGLDASQPIASCAISVDAEIVSSATILRPIENFPALIRKTINDVNITLNDIDEIVICIGPGSQTGVRAAVVTGNALALALNKPISGVLSTDSAAILYKKNGDFKIAVSAGRRRWYVGNYNWNGEYLQRLGKIQLEDETQANTFIAFGADSSDINEHMSCSCGILYIAEDQRQLLYQSEQKEIVPFERRSNNGG